MGRSPCCSKEGLNRGAWTAMEDKILTDYIKNNGEGKWRCLPQRAGLKRCGKSCRLRWLNYLRPDIKRGNITRDEEELIIRLHNLLGNRWSLIAGRLPGRTDNEIKNYWNTTIGKKIQTHRVVVPATTKTSTTTSRKPLRMPKTTQYSGDQLRYKNNNDNIPISSSTRSTSRVVRTKATKCTKVVLLPQDPQNQLLLTMAPAGSTDDRDLDQYYYSTTSKPAVDTVMPPSAVDRDDQLVNTNINTDLDHDQILGLEPSLRFVPDNIDDKFLSDFLDVDCLQLANCFGNGVDDHDHDGGDYDDHDVKISSCITNYKSLSSSKYDDLLLSQDLLYGLGLESASASMMGPAEVDFWLQDYY